MTASGATGAPAAVSAKGKATPASLCTAEGKGKPKRQCVSGLKKLDKGKAANPRSACKGMSKKKTKGVRGKSPYAVCVSAAAKLLAGKKSKGKSGNGAADGQAGDSGSAKATDDDDESSDGSAADEPDPICVDAKGKVVPFDSEDLEECEPGDTSASSSSDDDDLDSSDDSADDSSDDDE